jgi:hypothetical protein
MRGNLFVRPRLAGHGKLADGANFASDSVFPLLYSTLQMQEKGEKKCPLQRPLILLFRWNKKVHRHH